MTGQETIRWLDRMLALARAKGLDDADAAEQCFWDVNRLCAYDPEDQARMSASEYEESSDQADAAVAWSEYTAWRVFGRSFQEVSDEMPSMYAGPKLDHDALRRELAEQN